MRTWLATCAVLGAACSSPAHAPPPSTPARAAIAAPPTVAQPSAPPTTVAPDPEPLAPSWPAEPSTALVGGGCTAGEAITIAPAASSVALAATPSGALLAYASGEHVVTQALAADGHPAGEPGGIDIPHLGALLGLARLGAGLALVAAAGCTDRGWRHVCLVAAPLDVSGHAAGTQGSRALTYDTLDAAPTWDALAASGPLLFASPTAGAVWVVSAFDTSHDGNGIHVERISLGADGAAEVGARHSFTDTLPDGAALTGFRVSATDDELVVLFGSRADYEEPPISARYLGRFSTESTTQVGDLGNLVHDLVLDGGEVHVLFDRGATYFTSIVDRAGHVGEATPVDRTQPFAPPFATRVLVEMAGSTAHPQRVLHDASGRRLGDPIPPGPLAWLGSTLLVASGSESGGVRVTPLACRAP